LRYDCSVAVKRDKRKECGNPYCNKERLLDRYVCEEHAQELDRIREELESDPKLLYNQRSDNEDREYTTEKTSRKPGLPICCNIGCFELRVPPNPYCDRCTEEGVIYD